MDDVSLDNALAVKEFFRDKIESAKKELNPLMTNNPMFEELLYKEMQYISRKIDSIGFDVVISPDKNSISIISYKPVVDCTMMEFRGKNKAFIKSMIYLKERDLVCEYSQGVLFDRKLLEENGFRVGLSYESKMETNYTSRSFTEDGIEYSNNSYSDVYPFEDISNDIDLKERTLSSFHKPKFNDDKLASIPIHVINASVRNTYRKKDSLAIIHSNVGKATREGYKDVYCTLFSCHPSMPEFLRGERMIAKSEGNTVSGFTFVAVEDYAPSIVDGLKKAKEEFKNRVINSSLKEYRSRAYDYLINNI